MNVTVSCHDHKQTRSQTEQCDFLIKTFPTTMLLTHIKISLRNIRRHKLFSFINIFGLTLSLTICLAVLMIVKNQLDLDTFHPHPERTYRIITEATYENGGHDRWASSPLPLGLMMEEEYPFIQTSVRVLTVSYNPASANSRTLDVRGAFADPSFFQVFGFDLAYGDPSVALSNPSSIILSSETAERFFGDANPIGESFSIENIGEFTVTGVFGDNLKKSHLDTDLIVSMAAIPLMDPQGSIPQTVDNWDYRFKYTYLLLDEETSGESLAAVLPSFSERVSSTYQLPENVEHLSFEAQEIDAFGIGEELLGDLGKRRASQLIFYSVFALGILLMACFNYTNLSIARSLKQARAVGIYKVLGAQRLSIVTQFVVQATLVTLVSLLLAYLLLPFIPLLPGMMEEVRAVRPDLTLIGWFLLFSLITGAIAGTLPALLISSRQPVQMLKNLKDLNLIGGLKLRKSLVVVQFALSLVLIVFTLVVYQQSQFAATSDFGFRTENMLNLSLNGIDPDLLRNEISDLPGVEQISAMSTLYGVFGGIGTDIRTERTDEPINAVYYSVDRNSIPNMDLKLLAGTNFPESVSENRESHIIINELLLPFLDFETPAEAVGQTVLIDDSLQVEIAGVLENFHHETKSLPISRLVLRYKPEQFNYLTIRLASGSADNFSQQLEVIWEDVAPEIPLDYSLYDQYLYERHSHNQDVASIGYYGLIALTIACLGLLGMVTYTVEIRTQEVGIRKVLGAGVGRIIGLLSKEFIWLLVISTLIGLPGGYWAGQMFLEEEYAYHIDIGFGILFISVVILGILGLLAIGSQTWQVARQNPVDAISAE